MRVIDTPIADLKVIQLNVLGDERGFFVERFQASQWAAHGLAHDFVQDNHSRSAPGVLRGLHYQHEPAQGKLVGVTRGRIFDVAVDIRPHSPTFGRHVGLELSDMNGLLLWVPAGFAHGFCVMGDEPADVVYKVDAPYRREGEGGIRFDDAALAIAWPVQNPVLSARDTQQPSWQEYCANPTRWSAV
ncbi:MAG: dTDP-4-dehydrorhamnose 3,5-epimerase [Alphaproteobacteria bacterium]|nr:dTDP-4-dehydrorhamnose 3,5-epimerase [Alphaproteobacteria bacterium]